MPGIAVAHSCLLFGKEHYNCHYHHHYCPLPAGSGATGRKQRDSFELFYSSPWPIPASAAALSARRNETSAAWHQSFIGMMSKKQKKSKATIQTRPALHRQRPAPCCNLHACHKSKIQFGLSYGLSGQVLFGDESPS